jgi:hypothetical protein
VIEWLQSLVTGIVAGVIATGCWALIDARRRRGLDQARHAPLEGTYRVRKKGDHTDAGIVGKVELTLKDGILRTASVGSEVPRPWVGAIRMSEVHPGAGSGYYAHEAADGWGMHTVQRRGRDLLVHAEYVKQADRRLVADAYVWEFVERTHQQTA